ncbi:histidine phosphatase superfamily [Kickxella alabastrina]|uniref:histidine phosphatase superfamily n=1 Tax=Kickxella alabastrina TaxID=61397 RepID=UPI00221E37CB|nr:histidine phosphatase superfamily [Kickxella alabastrina]KAI7825079.1 histidine phosphatase superfamily [Kickxella alabastrina]KAJ1941747.1 hypothetical protein GGF37_003414 [Kickxella alabastrina]
MSPSQTATVVPDPPSFSQAAPLPKLTSEYMNQMYPEYLDLVQAQVFFRHGERTPVKQRLLETPSWPFCQRANHLHAEFMKAVGKFVPRQEAMPVPDPQRKVGDARYTEKTGTLKSGLEYEPAKWSVRLGNSGYESAPDAAADDRRETWDPKACEMGQLSDIGLDTLFRTGSFLRSLYIDKLQLLPPVPDTTSGRLSDWLYIRTTDYSRVIQSTHALLVGMYPGYPKAAWNGSRTSFNEAFLRLFPIHTRMHRSETMHGNFGCYNFIRHFIDISVHDAVELKWIRDIYQQTIALESIGKRAEEMMAVPHFGSNFHQVYDELVSLVAHGGELPEDISMDHMESLGAAAYHQWTGRAHYTQDQRLGFGRLVDNVVQTMAQAAALDSQQPGSERPHIGSQREGDLLLSPDGVRPPTDGEIPRVPKLALFGGHDVTVGPMSVIMGANTRQWLPFASTLTFELFKDKAEQSKQQRAKQADLPRPSSVPRDLDTAGHYVRVRLNDQVLQVPTCEMPGKHHPAMGSSMCTLAAFFEHLAPVIASEAEFRTECGTMPPTEM